MNIAICFTGQCRSLEHTYGSIVEKIIRPLKNYADKVDVFAYVAENKNSYKFHIKEFSSLAKRAGFTTVKSWADEKNLFSIHYLRVNTL